MVVQLEFLYKFKKFRGADIHLNHKTNNSLDLQHALEYKYVPFHY